jgi:hypothetical protein
VIPVATAAAQASPVRVVQSSDGTIYLVQAPNDWTLVPTPISDDDLGALTQSGSLNGAIPAPVLNSSGLSGSLQIEQDGNGTIYLVQAPDAWVLVPDSISDSDLTNLTPLGEADGTIPQQATTSAPSTPVSPPQASPPTPAPAPTNAPTPVSAVPATTTAVPASTLEGVWVGPNATATTTFTLHLNGTNVTGTWRGDLAGGAHIVYQLAGTFSNNTLKVGIPAILETAGAGMSWCPANSANATLTLSGNHLDGSQTGCSGGPIHLTKQS